MVDIKMRVMGLLMAGVLFFASSAFGAQASLSIEPVSYNGPQETQYLKVGIAQMVQARLSKAGVFVLDEADGGSLAITVTLFGGSADIGASIDKLGYHFSRSGTEAELMGFVRELADEVVGIAQGLAAPKAVQVTEKPVTTSVVAPVAKEGLRSEIFPFVIATVATGDLDGDGVVDGVAASTGKLQILSLLNDGITERAHVAVPNYLRAVRLDTFDFDKDGRMEVVLSAIHTATQSPITRVYRYEKETLLPMGREGAFLSSVVTIPGEGPVCIGQQVKGIDYWGGIKRVSLNTDGPVLDHELAMDEAFNVLGWDASATQIEGETGYFRLSESNRMGFWNDPKTQIYQGEDNYGVTQAFFSKVEGSKEREERRYLVSRVQAVDGPEYKGVGVIQAKDAFGSLFQGLKRYKSCRVVVVAWNGYELVSMAATPSLKGFVSDFSLVDIDGDGRQEAFCSVVNAKGGLSGKARSYFALSPLE